MTVASIVDVTAVAKLSPDVALQVKSCAITLDETWAPFMQIELVTARPSLAVEAALDPRGASPIRVELTGTQSWVTPARAAESRTFKAVVRRRTVNRKAKTLTLTLSGLEMLLLDGGRIGETPYEWKRNDNDTVSSVTRDVLSLSGMTMGATAADGSALITSASTNLFTNPSAEVSLADVASTNCTVTRVARGGIYGSGSWEYRLSASSNVDSWMNVGGDAGGMRLGMQAGKTYRVSGSGYPLGIGGSTTANSRSIFVFHRIGAAAYTVTISSQVPLVDGVGGRVSLQFTLPPGTTEAFIRFYHGHTVGSMYWDSLRLSEITDPTGNYVPYFDGDTVDTNYTYAWTGTPGLSTSTRTPRPGALAVDALQQQPGQSDWDFLQPVVQSRGLRLFADELGLWRLVDPTTYTVAGTLSLSHATHLVAADDEIDRDSDWSTGVVVEYPWIDPAGVPRKRYDFAGTRTRVKKYTYDRPYPGAGAAAALLARLQGRGRRITADSVIEWTATPGQVVEFTLGAGETVQRGAIAAVTWRFPDRTMEITPKNVEPVP